MQWINQEGLSGSPQVIWIRRVEDQRPVVTDTFRQRCLLTERKLGKLGCYKDDLNNKR